jgi:MFS family permease
LGIPLGTVGIYLALQMGGAAVSNFLWDWLSDHHGNRSVVVGTAFTAMLATLLAWLTPASQGWLYGGVFILLGATISGSSVGFANIILEMADEATRPVCVALRNTAMLPIAFAPLLIGIFARWLSYPLMFAIAAGIALMAFLLGIWKLPEPRNDPDAVCSL